jgi:hypothetical protein
MKLIAESTGVNTSHWVIQQCGRSMVEPYRVAAKSFSSSYYVLANNPTQQKSEIGVGANRHVGWI